jgi:hypothetical protein
MLEYGDESLLAPVCISLLLNYECIIKELVMLLII